MLCISTSFGLIGSNCIYEIYILVFFWFSNKEHMALSQKTEQEFKNKMSATKDTLHAVELVTAGAP